MTHRIIAALVGLALIAGLLLWGPAACRSYFTAKQEARVAKGQAGAAIDSGAEAMNTVSNVAASDAASDQAKKDGLDAIRSAPEGQRGDATVRQSCKLRQYANSERCAALRKADSAASAGAGAGRGNPGPP